jgi:hypothetical protein
VNLDKLSLKYHTDKGSGGHWYTKFYTKIFGPIRKNIESMLEIGVSDGASIRMWLDYFPNAWVHGLDINDVTGDFGVRFRFYKFDQADEEGLLSVFLDKKLEIVIDDGSHDEQKTLASLKYIFPLIQPDGWYVIEDMNPNGFPRHFYQWMELYSSYYQSIQFFTDAGNGSHIIFIHKRK